MNSRSLPLVSVIVPVWNRPEDIRNCLGSLMRQTLPREQFEIIVVDNGSTDDTAEVARGFPDVTVLVEERPGSYAARNKGIETARGGCLAFTDSDCQADPRWLEQGLHALEENPDAGIIAGRIELSPPDAGASPTCSAYERTFAFNQEKNVARGAAVTANWVCRRAVIDEVGGFRSELKSGGDFELSRRIGRAGHGIVYDPRVLVYHPARATFTELVGKSRRVIGGRMMAHRDRRNPLSWWAGLAIDSARRLQTICKARHLQVRMKVQLVFLVLALLAASSLEVLFLTFGAEPRRA